MPYIEEDKSKGIEESYIPDWIEDATIDLPKIEEIPGLNSPQLNQDISIET